MAGAGRADCGLRRRTDVWAKCKIPLTLNAEASCLLGNCRLLAYLHIVWGDLRYFPSSGFVCAVPL